MGTTAAGSRPCSRCWRGFSRRPTVASSSRPARRRSATCRNCAVRTVPRHHGVVGPEYPEPGSRRLRRSWSPPPDRWPEGGPEGPYVDSPGPLGIPRRPGAGGTGAGGHRSGQTWIEVPTPYPGGRPRGWVSRGSCSAPTTCSCWTNRPTIWTVPAWPGSGAFVTNSSSAIAVVSHDRQFLPTSVRGFSSSTPP